jgi:hypothetical protein
MRWSRNIKKQFRVPCWIGLIRRSRIEVPGVDYEKLSGRSKPDSGGNDAAQLVGAGVSPHPFDRLRKSLKLARTIADLAGCEEIGSVHSVGRAALRCRPRLMQG